jgi:hypothetical protein
MAASKHFPKLMCSYCRREYRFDFLPSFPRSQRRNSLRLTTPRQLAITFYSATVAFVDNVYDAFALSSEMFE